MEMYPLYQAGAFGNKMLNWSSLAAYFDSGYRDKRVVLRYKGAAGGGWTAYNLTHDEVFPTVETWVQEGANISKIVVSEFVPDELITLQGEVQRSTGYLDLRYSTAQLPMRKALETAQVHTTGICANALLRRFLDPDSFDLLWELLDRYDGAAIEFSSFSQDVGDVPGRNTIFWEVRHY
jgi:hypothetical protein